MTIRTVCPKCDALLEPDGLQAVPPFCPSCGGRIACPRCGRLLQSDPRQPAQFRCAECHLTLAGDETISDAAGVSDPGLQSMKSTTAVEIPGFELRGVLGRGGMGIVHRAWQRSLQREVAIKVLPPALAADPSRLERFRNEASVAAGLTDSHILPIHDIQEVQGVPVLVMPLIDGADLAKIIHDRLARRNGQAPSRPHPWALLDDRAYLDHLLPLLDQMVDAVTVIHQAGVLHRDLKPSNALVDSHGNLWLTDFGLARLELKGAGTSPGQVMGTPGFMAPEQARGDQDLDFRADLFSLGATLYKALTLEMPYGERGEKGGRSLPLPPSKRQPLLSRDFDAVLLKALEWDRDLRYPSAKEFRDDWRRVRQGLLPKARRIGRPQRLVRWTRRHPREVVGILMIAVLVAVVGFVLSRDTNPPDVDSPDPTRTVFLTSEPEGARVVLVPLDENTGDPVEKKAIRPEEKTPVTIDGVPAGEYLVVAKWPNNMFHEVYRIVPAFEQFGTGNLHGLGVVRDDGTVDLPVIPSPSTREPDREAYLKGGEFDMGTKRIQGVDPHRRTVAPFYLDTTEVTVEDYYKVRSDLKPEKSLIPNHAITGVSFKLALEYAERVGKRLPDEAEYEFAATAGGQRDFPWGNKPQKMTDWPLGEVGKHPFDFTKTNPKVFGLFSNVVEWTVSRNWPYPSAPAFAFDMASSPEIRIKLRNERIVRGGPPWVALQQQSLKGSEEMKSTWSARSRYSLPQDQGYPGVGFRCARSARPRFLD